MDIHGIIIKTQRMQLAPEWDHLKTGYVGEDYIQKGK